MIAASLRSLRSEAKRIYGRGLSKEKSWSTKRYLSKSSQAVRFGGNENSITFPRCCGGSHFKRFGILVGM